LIVIHPWSTDTYTCPRIDVVQQEIRVICPNGAIHDHTQNADHIFDADFSERPWGPYSYKVTQQNNVILRQQTGCREVYFDLENDYLNVEIICW